MLEELGAPAELLHTAACHHDARAARTAGRPSSTRQSARRRPRRDRCLTGRSTSAALLALAASLSWGFSDFLGGIKAQVLPASRCLPRRAAVRAAARARHRGSPSPGTGIPGDEVAGALAAALRNRGAVRVLPGAAPGRSAS
jgi:hypothetical protein